MLLSALAVKLLNPSSASAGLKPYIELNIEISFELLLNPSSASAGLKPNLINFLGSTACIY